jgi:hypothetical protein
VSEPKRWKETEAEELRTMVGELARVEPTREVREAVWEKIAASLPPPPGGSSGSGADGAGGAGAGLRRPAAA